MDRIDSTIDAATGYLALGMPEDAEEELLSLPFEEQHQPEVLRLRLEICIRQETWEKGVAIGREMLDKAPDLSAAYILTAYCLRELDQIDEAKTLLVTGPESLRLEPIFYYNLACYESLLGEIKAAGDWLLQAFSLDENLRREAKSDHDLDNLRAAVGDDLVL